MNKRIIVFLLIVGLILSTFGLSGCSSGGQSQGTPSDKAAKNHTIIGTSQIAGSWYPAASKIAGIVMSQTDSLITVQSTGGSTENVKLISRGELGMGLVSSTVLPSAYEGTGEFEGNPNKNLRFVVALFPQVLQAVVHKSSNINTISELKGTKMSAGTPGSGDLVDWELVLGYYGLTTQDLDWRPLSSTERAMGFKDNILDCIAYTSACPNGTILEASSQTEIRLLAIEGEKRESILKDCPWYAPFTIPANTYNGQDVPVDTISNLTLVVADETVDDEIIYDFVKAIYENLDDVQSVHPMAKEINLDTALYGKGDIPLHSGAEKYYKEVGIVK